MFDLGNGEQGVEAGVGGKASGQGEREKKGESPRNKVLWQDDHGGKTTRRKSVLMPQV